MKYNFRVIPSTRGSGYFCGKALIAAPWIVDPFFRNSVIFLCTHHDEGAVGIVINRPYHTIATKKLYDVFNVKTSNIIKERYKVYSGGGVDDDRYYILAEEEVPNGLSHLFFYTEISDFLIKVLKGNKKHRFLIFRGICTWYPGQLEYEISENLWVVGDIDRNILFGNNNKMKWKNSLKSVGIKNSKNLIMHSIKI